MKLYYDNYGVGKYFVIFLKLFKEKKSVLLSILMERKKKWLENHKITLSFKIRNYELINSLKIFKFYVELNIQYAIWKTIKCL